MKQLSDHLQSFLDEAKELIESLEKKLLLLEENRQDKSAIHDFFRAMHTLKGSSSMFGFVHLSDFAHHFESIFDKIRNDELTLNQVILDVSFDSLDHFRTLLLDPQLSNKENKKQHKVKIKGLASLLNASELSDSSNSQENYELTTEAESKRISFHIHIKPKSGAFTAQVQFLPAISNLSEKGELLIVPNTTEIPTLDEFYPFDMEFISWDIVFSGCLTQEELHQEFILIQAFSEIEIIQLCECSILESETIFNFIQSKIELSSGLHAFELMELLAVNETVVASEIESKTTDEQTENKSVAGNTESVQSIRVHVQKLDTLLSLVSELVTAQARLNVFVDANSNNGLQEVAEDIEKITRRLRENAFAISMIPISTIETRFQRIVRDISTAEHKKVQLVCSGLETELEKSLIESLTPPLLHIFRNAIDHGIELPEDRIKKGKPEVGTVKIQANYAGANVVIEVSDDGKGINLETIRKKGIEKGFIKSDQAYSEKQLLDLLFRPGFSTSETITEVSGRGVGMDVVRTAMNQMRGDVFIETQEGLGSKITLRLPLNLSILDGLLIRVDQQKFIIPLQFMDKCYEIPHFERNQKNDDIVVIEGEQLPYIDMRDIVESYENRPLIDSLIVVKYQNTKVGILADQIIGEHQAVVKSLGTLFKNVHAVSGATILGDGEIALILDVNKVISEYIMTTNLINEVTL